MVGKQVVTIVEATYGDATDLERRVRVTLVRVDAWTGLVEARSWFSRNSKQGQLFRRALDAASTAQQALEGEGDASEAERLSQAAKYLTAAMAYVTAAYRMVPEDCADFHWQDFRRVEQLIADLLACQCLAAALHVEATTL
jgi:hypothetical protein